MSISIAASMIHGGMGRLASASSPTSEGAAANGSSTSNGVDNPTAGMGASERADQALCAQLGMLDLERGGGGEGGGGGGGDSAPAPPLRTFETEEGDPT
eukprot:COSAG06_NODE_577_length_14043_cov_5.505952_2_plen_99_part_00